MMMRRPLLAIEGDPAHLRDWRARFASLGGSDVRQVRRMPLDRRHGSKIDLPRLRSLIQS